MGLWSFVKDAGSSLFGSKAEAAEAPEAAAAKEDALKKEVEKLGLDAKDVSIKVDGDTVKLSGTAATPEEQEKVILAVGNVEGVEKVEDDLVADQADAAATFYTVKKGDNLGAIAKAHYGKAGAYMKSYEANQPLLKDPDRIYPGQVLRIPAA